MNHLFDERDLPSIRESDREEIATLATSGRVALVVIGPYPLRGSLLLLVSARRDNHLVLLVRPMAETFSRRFFVRLQDHVTIDVAPGEPNADSNGTAPRPSFSGCHRIADR